MLTERDPAPKVTYNSVYIKNLDKVNPWRQEAHWWLPMAREKV